MSLSQHKVRSRSWVREQSWVQDTFSRGFLIFGSSGRFGSDNGNRCLSLRALCTTHPLSGESDSPNPRGLLGTGQGAPTEALSGSVLKVPFFLCIVNCTLRDKSGRLGGVVLLNTVLYQMGETRFFRLTRLHQAVRKNECLEDLALACTSGNTS